MIFGGMPSGGRNLSSLAFKLTAAAPTFRVSAAARTASSRGGMDDSSHRKLTPSSDNPTPDRPSWLTFAMNIVCSPCAEYSLKKNLSQLKNSFLCIFTILFRSTSLGCHNGHTE